MELNEPKFKESLEYRRALRKVKALKGFYRHLTVYLVINLLLFFLEIHEQVRNSS